jgi:hypothetical protein
MSNKNYTDTSPSFGLNNLKSENNKNISFNYIWDEDEQYWTPETKSNLAVDYIINNAKATIHKFGSNPNISQSVSVSSPETIWDGSSEYEFPLDLGESIQVKSSNTGDSQEIIVQGLDENFLEQSWTGNLNGTTAVNVQGLWSRVFRAFNNDSSDISGDINIFKSGDTSKSYAQILNGNNQTLMSVYTIPANCTGYLIKYQATAHNSQSSSEIGYTLQMKTREEGKVFRVKSTTSVSTSFEVSKDYLFPLKLEPKTDIIFNAVSANGNNGAINVDFDIALL